MLPDDVRVLAAAPAPSGFDARFSALSRTYAYRVTDRIPNPLRRGDTLAWRRPLSEVRMADAAADLVGEHDFAGFCRRRQGATTVRRLLRLEWSRDDDGVLVAAVEADAFCHQMVRSLVGALLAVGDGRRPVTWPAELLQRRERASAVNVAPAHALVLTGVSYPPEEELAARAAVTRQVRSAPPRGA
jgi:tRNA pseudouridine38-40 synthase